MASTYLTRTPSSAGNLTTWTLSMWVKRSSLDGERPLFSCRPDGNNETFVGFGGNNLLYFKQKTSGSTSGQIVTNRVFRDTSAWYNLVFVYDINNGTAGDRGRLYVNGVRETSFSAETTFSQNSSWNSTTSNAIGISQSAYFDGSMAHVHFIDGLAYQASTFGETDSLTGIWKPITSPSVTYGTNGFFLKFASSGSMGTDSSGNSNNFTVNGNLTQTQDTPSNVFSTMNPLDNFYAGSTFTNGNTTIQTTNGNYTFNTSTIGASKGKYYTEIEYDTGTHPSADFAMIGVSGKVSTATSNTLGDNTGTAAYQSDDGQVHFNGTTVSYGDSYTKGDIIGIALDIDNSKLYFSKNGVWQNSGDPTSGATGTGAISITDVSSTDIGSYFIAVGDVDATYNYTFKTNFGNGYFGTTPVASAGTNASGIGIFEYDVPTGYTALSTKGLNL